jgi:multidrug efflux pump
MKLSQKAIEYPRLVILGALVFCAMGIGAILTLPKERTPRVRLPVIIVAIANPGAPPPVNETEIIRPIEDEAGNATLPGLKSSGGVISQAVNGAAVVVFIFDESIDVETAKRNVTDLINRVKGQFPLLAQRDPGPIINDVAFEDFPIIQVFVAGGTGENERREVTDRLKDLMEDVEGISDVDVFGDLDREIQIEVDPNRMTLYGFDYETIRQQIARANLDAAGGALESGGGTDTRIRTEGKLKDLPAIRAVPLGVREGKPIVLSDVAKVTMGHTPRKSIARYDGKEAVVLLARPRTDIDVLATANRVQDLVDQFVASGGGGKTLIGTSRSQAREIRYMLTQLGTSALYGICLVIIILWIAMGWRNAALISLAVPFSLLGAAGIMLLTKKTITPDLAINNMMMFATILVVGMVVDGCIIVGENIYRHRELGRSPVDAAKKGIEEVGMPLVSAYMTTFAAFAGLFMVRGIMGDFMQVLPIVVCFSLISAMLVDHFLLPVLSMYLMKVPKKKRDKVKRQQDEIPEDLSPEDLEIANAEAVVAASPAKRVYGRMLNYALSNRLLVLLLSAITVFAPIGLYMSGAIGVEFFPAGDTPWMEVYFELPLGSSMEGRTAEVSRVVEKTVLKAVRPEEWHRPSANAAPARPVTTIGSPGALNIRIQSDQGVGPEFGKVYVELEMAEKRERSADEIGDAITAALPQIPGVIMRVIKFSEGPPAGSPVAVRVLGRKNSDVTMEQLALQAKKIESLLKAVPGLRDISNDYRVRPELTVTPKRILAQLYDLDAAQIASSVNFALEGVKVGEVDFGGDESIDLRLRNLASDRNDYDDLVDLPLRSPTGRIVALQQVAEVKRIRNVNVIRHYDEQRVINVRADLAPGVLADDAKQTLIRALRPDLSAREQKSLLHDRDNLTIYSDSRVLIEFGGENEIRDDALEDLRLAMFTSMGLMLIILVWKFNSFVQPLIVLFSVPLSLVGVALGLMICGFYFSVAAMIGVVALSGIVVNDAIVLVDFINRLRDTGVPIKKAIIYAGQLRLRPIFITTITTIVGLLPLGLNLTGGGEFFQPLTVSIMFGLGFATLLQLFIIPLAIYTFDGRRNKGLLDPMDRPEFAGTKLAETKAPAAD